MTDRILRLAIHNDVAEEMPPADDQLAELRWHWDTAYAIECSHGEWTARFRDDTTVLSAASADDLRTLIWEAYSRRKASTATGRTAAPLTARPKASSDA